MKNPPVMCDNCQHIRPDGIATCPACGTRCEHSWHEVTRSPLRYEPGRVFGTQRCTICGATSTYHKDENE